MHYTTRLINIILTFIYILMSKLFLSVILDAPITACPQEDVGVPPDASINVCPEGAEGSGSDSGSDSPGPSFLSDHLKVQTMLTDVHKLSINCV